MPVVRTVVGFFAVDVLAAGVVAGGLTVGVLAAGCFAAPGFFAAVDCFAAAGFAADVAAAGTGVPVGSFRFPFACRYEGDRTVSSLFARPNGIHAL